ncbi:putative Peptidyl-prolyl cis-trans isomerase FKBP12 [Blattamonas nauphoetae]|uniref:peptidylprolyl isomerase n=1 Tax=Blattamonas nauphoetae TaxID=2049346 RepID=A0ABQ9Y061_9EUKA|nr:putative Peptidyl-prolyl cis-trans isomerase FKBP12 [Blattamonas nauphoetae]
MGWTKQIKKEGSGNTPTKGQNITVHCTGYLDKECTKKFWSTKDPGQQPFGFQVGVGQVIRGWDEGFMSMKVGECAVLEMTGDYAYGARGFPQWGIGPNATLWFDVEILSFN